MQKTTDTFKEFPVSAPGSNYLGHRFVAQSVGMEYVGGFTFSAVRSLLGSVVLIPLILISGRKNSADTAATKDNSFVGSSDGTIIQYPETKRPDHRRYFLRNLPLSGKQLPTVRH